MGATSDIGDSGEPFITASLAMDFLHVCFHGYCVPLLSNFVKNYFTFSFIGIPM